ncbi:F-box protein At5g50450-like isoform X2 [Gastrolobium bilobum]|uniref:F-box protein At5g50450-like isoform X2 n=1 Tax=Gastrolobium bilobum TaxID=150636 RepID=UPI002AB1B715|nr:F-box protein At5g50450-like isoform X2 [Gastrolobium bilobum]
MRRPLRYSHNHRTDKNNPLDAIPDDLVIFILSKLSSISSSPSDFITILLTCKRLSRLGLNRLVLSKLGAKAFAVKPKKWSESANRFLNHCANAGNADACYTLGMIRFYCLQNRRSGLSLMAKAAMRLHAPAMYSLAVIQFNGSGGSKSDKDLRAGVALCARASLLGHIDALRELGHCLQDGYGVRQDVAEGRRLLVQANAHELAFVMRAVTSLPSGNGYNGAVQPVNRFLREWFESGRGGLGEGLRLCAHVGCGRAETREQEFRRCSVCGKVNYCSRGCQALDWKLRHKMECSPVELWVDENEGRVGGGDGGGGAVGDDEGIVEMGN